MGLKMALFKFAVHISTEIKLLTYLQTYLEELRKGWGPWCQNMSQLCPSRLHCCRPANEMFILFVLLWYFWYWIMVYFNKSTKQGVACFKCNTLKKSLFSAYLWRTNFQNISLINSPPLCCELLKVFAVLLPDQQTPVDSFEISRQQNLTEN